MKYIIALALPFLIAGCFGCDPDCHCPEQESDEFVWSLSAASDGGALVVGSRFTHDVGDEIGPLDCSCPGNYESRFIWGVSAGGQDEWGSAGGYSYYGEVVRSAGYYGDDVVQAGFTVRTCDEETGWVPVIYVVHPGGTLIRYAVIECHFFEDDYWGEEEWPHTSRTALITSDGGALFWGPRMRWTDGHELLKVSTYGEVLWERGVPYSPRDANITELATGELLVVEQSGTVRLLSDGGVQIWERHVGSNDASPHSGTQVSETGFAVSGSVTNGTESNPMVWHLDPTGTVLDSVEVDYPGCQDSVRVVTSWLGEEILVCRHRADCGENNKVLLLRLNAEGDTLSSFIWGGTGNTVPRCAAVPDEGNLYVAAMSNTPMSVERDTYSAVLAKFSSTLHLLWTRSF